MPIPERWLPVGSRRTPAGGRVRTLSRVERGIHAAGARMAKGASALSGACVPGGRSCGVNAALRARGAPDRAMRDVPGRNAGAETLRHRAKVCHIRPLGSCWIVAGLRDEAVRGAN